MDEIKPKVKRTRKPKAIKEQHNNIDSIILENINDIDNLENTENTNNIQNNNTNNPEISNPDPINEPIPEISIQPKKTRGRKKKEVPVEPAHISITENILNDNEEQINELEIQKQSTEINTNPNHNIEIIKFEYTTPITHIYHFSDIHIQLYKRHDEYQNIFDKLYEYLKGEKAKYKIPEKKNTNIPLIALLTGDILHSKSDLSPE